MANMKNSTESMFNASQVFQDAYALKMERMNSADPNKRSQGLESWLMEQNENYLNYADTKPVIDKYGQVQLMRKDKDGSIEYLTPEQLNNRSKAQYNYFNSDAELTRMEVGLGDEMIQTLKAATVGKVGSIQEISDKSIKEGFNKAVDDYINSLDAPINISSVLTNDIGGAYINNFTYSIDEANADPNKILLKVPKGREGNPEPDFTSTENGKNQEKEVKAWLKRQLIEKLDRKIGVAQTSAVGYRPSSGDGYNKSETAARNFAENMYTFYHSTDPAEVETASNYLVSQAGENFVGGLGKNEYGTFTRGKNLPGTSGEKQGRALVGVLDQDPAYAETIMKYYLDLGGGSTISKTKAQSGKKATAATSGGKGSTAKAGIN
jgi:hypothetical protein